MIGIINNIISTLKERSRKQSGMTIVEVVIAFFIIGIISTILVRGTITAVNTVRANKSKTIALAVANEKIELIRSMNYSDILITETYPDWAVSYPELAEESYNVSYEVSWANDNSSGYKQVKVSVLGGYLNVPVEVVTRLFPPVGDEATGGNVYPPPEDLRIISDAGEGGLRQVVLEWTVPEAEITLLRFNIYRDSVLVGTALTGYYPDSPGDDLSHTYNVSTIYDGEIESVLSNSASTGTPTPYPPPQNLAVTYTYMGTTRVANLSWDLPDTELLIAGYSIYRDYIEIGIVVEPIASITIANTDYTFYVTTLYESDIEGEYFESEPSNIITTPLP